jgi:primosomal protein N' (replication factor Y)
VRLEFRHTDPEVAEQEAHKLAEKFLPLLNTEPWKLITVIGPVPAFFAKIGGVYRWQIVLRGPNPVSALQGLRLDGWRIEVDPISLL